MTEKTEYVSKIERVLYVTTRAEFDEAWNGQVVSELVDWKQTHDLYRGLHFPATDIPAQVRIALKPDLPCSRP